MTVASALLLIQLLSGIGTVSLDVLKIKKDLEQRAPDSAVPAEHLDTLKAALGSGGSVWDETHAGE
jgi:hypothetical protein